MNWGGYIYASVSKMADQGEGKVSDLHVHTSPPISQEWGGLDPVRKYVLDSGTARLVRLRDHNHRRGGVEELVDPRHDQRIGRQDGKFYLRFLIFRQSI